MPFPSGLRPEQFAIVRRILRQHVPDREVWVFGSRITPTPKPASDLDLAILGKQSVPIAVLAHLRAAFEESSLPFKVDLLDWNALTPAFRRIIMQHYEVIQRP